MAQVRPPFRLNSIDSAIRTIHHVMEGLGKKVTYDPKTGGVEVCASRTLSRLVLGQILYSQDLVRKYGDWRPTVAETRAHGNLVIRLVPITQDMLNPRRRVAKPEQDEIAQVPPADLAVVNRAVQEAFQRLVTQIKQDN